MIVSNLRYFQGIAKKDEMCMPMNFEDNQANSNLDYLSAATNIFIEWKKSRFSQGLTDQTFLACIQTISAVPELGRYLQCKLHLKYILPGKFTSDPIDGRFGWYRQASGGNFFISVKQLLEAEKKIRTISVFQQKVVLGASQLTSQQHSFLKNDESSNCSRDSCVNDMVDFLLSINIEDISENDANVAFYVSGYIARSITRRRKCSHCKAMLMKSEDAPPLPLCQSEDHAKLFEMANRGGLSEPSEFCFALTVLSLQCYAAIIGNDEAKSAMMTATNQRSVFVARVRTVIEKSASFHHMHTNVCLKGHSNCEVILQIVFNCFSKNELKRFNAPKSEAPPLMARKVRKLASGSSAKNV